MAVGLKPPPEMAPVPGVRLAAGCAGLRKRGGDDLALLELAPGSRVAAVFTQNAFCAAPVYVAKEHMESGRSRALLINAGNANAGTGHEGIQNARRCCESVAELMGCGPEQVLPFSTGVIGEPLPVDSIRAALDGIHARLAEDQWLGAAQAILTTDTLAKGVSRQLPIGGQTITITGMAKGSGMIRPDMATMLAFVATDAEVEDRVLDDMLRKAVRASFNRITVDGDTSTNDAVVLVATGSSGVAVRSDSPELDSLRRAVVDVCTELAQAIVRDGEGATKFVTVEVRGGSSEDECLRVAYTVAHSPLVKTALFASDPNWGRILAAVGRAGIDNLDVEGVSIHLGGVCIVRAGARAVDYREDAGQAVMDQQEIEIVVDLGRGDFVEKVWTTDLSHEYVRINAEYRT